MVANTPFADLSSSRMRAAAYCWLRLPGNSSAVRSVMSSSRSMSWCRKVIFVDSIIVKQRVSTPVPVIPQFFLTSQRGSGYSFLTRKRSRSSAEFCLSCRRA